MMGQMARGASVIGTSKDPGKVERALETWEVAMLKNSHTLSVQETLKKLSVDPTRGLSSEEARNRLEKYGPNGIFL